MDPLVNMQALGEQLLLLRRRAGLSQSALAQRAGIDTMTVSRVESGQKKRLELETAARLARVFAVSLDQLCGLKTSSGQGDPTASAAVPPAQEPAPMTALSPEDENTLAAQIFVWNKETGLSLQAIVQRLNATKVPTRSGRGQWYQASVYELLRQRIPQTQKNRKAFLARYAPERPLMDEQGAAPAPSHPKRPRTHKAAPVG
jgi:transcriptional regulator with XRE-family HTH domain